MSGTRAGFLRVLSFPLPSISSSSPHSSYIAIRGWYNRPVMASAVAGSVPLHLKKEKIINGSKKFDI
jgi:hypothetical protein